MTGAAMWQSRRGESRVVRELVIWELRLRGQLCCNVITMLWDVLPTVARVRWGDALQLCYWP
ncbi:MAG: hypothetical protein NVS2B7_34470 [Herpetosiphon sp.]